jgi:gluconate 2-dehydrogenase gamma chain
MERRDLLRAIGSAAALSLLPSEEALAAWTRVASGRAPLAGLSAAHLARIAAIADTILPRTDTPSATDVGVPAFVDVIVSENYTDDERTLFVANLDAIDPASLDAIEAQTDRAQQPARTYWRLKGLVVHGYFTSERVMKDVLKAQVMPGRFDGNAPMPLVRRGANG